ncbi:MAG: hypothetical protein K2X52_10140 [Mycobacteriaceae bacterium]|nr:hypothetical protein [Mycobacteriaceae bacterium]
MWAPTVLLAASTVATGFAINFLTTGTADWWWWVVLGAGSLGFIAGTVWTILALRDHGADEATPPAIQGDGVAQQTATDSGANISIVADNSSAAAWQMGEVHIGRPHKRGKREKS